MSDDTKQTTIGEGTEFEGTVRSEAHVRLGGVLKGKLDAPALTVTPSGKLHARVKVEELRSEGTISGEIEADSVELAGQIQDDTVIRARRLEVMLSQDDGGVEVSFGNCDLEVGTTRERSTECHRDEDGRTEDESRTLGDAKVVGTTTEAAN